jgi:hypothetical protein
VIIAPAHDGGTNALVVSPPDAMPFAYGPDSCAAHQKAAAGGGLSCLIMPLPSLLYDVDRSADLNARLGARPGPLAGSVFLMRRADIIAVPGLPEVKAGDDLAALIGDALVAADLTPGEGDILTLAHKIVSKAEGRVRRLADIVPGEEAQRYAWNWARTRARCRRCWMKACGCCAPSAIPMPAKAR